MTFDLLTLLCIGVGVLNANFQIDEIIFPLQTIYTVNKADGTLHYEFWRKLICTNTFRETKYFKQLKYYGRNNFDCD